MNSDIDSASDNRDIEWFKDTVLEIWNRLPVPEGDIARDLRMMLGEIGTLTAHSSMKNNKNDNEN